MSMVVDIHKKNGVRPEFDVYIGRRGHSKSMRTEFPKDSKWCNPYRLSKYTPEESLRLFEKHIRYCIEQNPVYFNLDELKGKRLGCWCITTSEIYPIRCHGQVLMKLLREKRSN